MVEFGPSRSSRVRLGKNATSNTSFAVHRHYGHVCNGIVSDYWKKRCKPAQLFHQPKEDIVLILCANWAQFSERINNGSNRSGLEVLQGKACAC